MGRMKRRRDLNGREEDERTLIYGFLKKLAF